MRIKVLGSSAGGGFPQWNCRCPNCSALRQGRLKARPRTQTQLIFSPDSRVWFLLCASPDLRQQVLSAHELAPPSKDSSSSPIGGIFLPNADVDSVMGLLHLREFQSFFVFATRGVQCVLQQGAWVVTCQRILPRLRTSPAGRCRWEALIPIMSARTCSARSRRRTRLSAL